MTATETVDTDEDDPAAPQSRRRWWLWLQVAIVAVVASPIVIGAVFLIGDTWYPANDWAVTAHRVSQVGTSETPLVGPYSRGSAHPGPLGLWLGAPLHKLTGGDTRSLAWSAAVVNVAVVAALSVVAWRRGRWPLFLGTMALVAVLVRGFGPEVLIDLWNPYLPLMSFALTVFLVWAAALGHRWALLAAVVPASLVMQSHVAFVPLVGLMAVWLFGWLRWWPPGEPTTPLRELWSSWRRPVRRGLALGAVLWSPPLLDAVFGIHNPWLMLRSSLGGDRRIGPIDAVGLVGRYVRPDGPWMGGAEPTAADIYSVQGSGPLPLLVALAVLGGCLYLAYRRGWTDVAALAALTAVLVVGAISAVARLPLPAEVYLLQWLKVAGGLVWFTAAWTLWRLAERAVRAVPVRGVAAAGLVVGILIAATTSQWGLASSIKLHTSEAGLRVQALYADLEGDLPRDQTIRVVQRGDHVPTYAAGLFYVLAQEGYDVVTEEGAKGYKWGERYRWQRGDPYDMLLTVAVNQANDPCDFDSQSELLARYDTLSPADRAWLTDVRLRRLEGSDATTPAERRRADELDRKELRLGVYEGPRPCAKDPKRVTTGPDESPLPVVAATVGLAGLALAGWFVLSRRSGSPSPGSPDGGNP